METFFQIVQRIIYGLKGCHRKSEKNSENLEPIIMTNIKPRDFKIGDFNFGVLDNAVQISTKDNWVFLDHTRQKKENGRTT